MSGIPYNKLQTIDCTAKKEDGESATIAVLHYVFVIPCRDCVHYDPHPTDGGVCFLPDGDGDFARWEVKPDGFCAWGERRDA